jgi:multiple sugar transport system substrate-binding protein
MWSGEWLPHVENICKRFNDSQSEYEVIPLQVPAESAETKFLVSAAGGISPDVISQWNPILGMWTERGLIRPLDELMTTAGRDAYVREAYPIMKKQAMYKGRVMALIAGVDVNACFYRLDHLREIGLDAQHLPKTLEEFVAVASKLDRYDKSGRLHRVGFLPTAFQDFVPSFGGTFNTPTGPLLGSTKQRAAFDWMEGQYKRLGFDTVTRFLSAQAHDDGANCPLNTGNYSIMLDGEWRVKQASDVAPNVEYCVALLPPPAGGKPLASNTAANYLVIPRAARNPQGALAFMKFLVGMSNPELGAQNLAEMGWLPYCDRVANAKSYRAYLQKFPKFQPFVEMMSSPNLEIAPSGPNQSFIMDQIQKANDSVTHGTKPSEQAMDDLVTAVQVEAKRQRRLGHG